MTLVQGVKRAQFSTKISIFPLKLFTPAIKGYISDYADIQPPPLVQEKSVPSQQVTLPQGEKREYFTTKIIICPSKILSPANKGKIPLGTQMQPQMPCYRKNLSLHSRWPLLRVKKGLSPVQKYLFLPLTYSHLQLRVRYLIILTFNPLPWPRKQETQDFDEQSHIVLQCILY